MRLLLMVSILIWGCSKQSTHDVNYGITTASQLEASQGKPTEVTAIPETKGEMYHYSEGHYQIQNKIVTAKFRDPNEDEVSLLYWRHFFKEYSMVEKTSVDSKSMHPNSTIEYSCPELGLSVIYDRQRDLVTRVVEYAQTTTK